MGASHVAGATAAVGVDGGAAGLSPSAGHYAAQVGQGPLSEESPTHAEAYGPAAFPELVRAEPARISTNASDGHG
jgi:hypothetical protein